MLSTESSLVINSDFIVDFEERIVRDSKSNITRQTGNNELRLLEFFCQNPNKVLSKQDIMQHVWENRGVFVEEGSLLQCIFNTRRLLGSDGSKVIKTVRGQGYIFTGYSEKVAYTQEVSSLEMPEKSALPENALPENALPENALSENAMTENASSENALSENALPENALSENALPENALPENTHKQSSIYQHNLTRSSFIIQLAALIIAPIIFYSIGYTISEEKNLIFTHSKAITPKSHFNKCTFKGKHFEPITLEDVNHFTFHKKELWVDNKGNSVSNSTQFEGIYCE